MSRPLHEALERLRQEFPDANLRDARLEFRFGERAEFKPYVAAETWNKVHWSVQIDNNSGSGESLEEAVAAVRKKIDREATIPDFAKRLADILREIPEYHDRYRAAEAAQFILDEERRR